MVIASFSCLHAGLVSVLKGERRGHMLAPLVVSYMLASVFNWTSAFSLKIFIYQIRRVWPENFEDLCSL